MAEPPRGTVTLLFTDIEGSTLLLRRLGDRYPELLGRHRRLLREAFEQHGGYVLDSEGDAFFVAFESATEAATGAAQAQRALAEYDWPAGNEIRVRMGLHTGELRPVEGTYVGLDVHEAARVMAAAHGGQVILTDSTRALLDKSVRLRDLGQYVLRDIPGEQRIYQLEIDGLPGDFPPLNTEATLTTNLPAVPTAFIGRERELAEAASLLSLDDVKLLTLVGPGGAGKTRLAIEVAGNAIKRFPGGVFFVLLTQVRDWELVVATIGQTLGLGERPGETPLETLTEHLRNREVLLLLDNFEHLVGAAPALSGLLAGAPGLKLLVTSRTPLRLGVERVYRVPQLADQDSLRLFVERARAVAEDFELDGENSADVAEIVARLDGLPLAIELAAPWVRTLTPRALLRRLDRRLPLLTGGARDADERQQTLRGTIEWSYDLLSEPQRAEFRRLAVFVGGFRFEAAEAVCTRDAAGADVLQVLDSLVEQSLLLRRVDSDGEPRFWMLETIREYAYEQLETSGEADAVRRLHAEWFTTLAEDLESESRAGDQPAAVARLDADYGNLRAAISWAREADEGELLLRLATALSPFWSTRGYVAEGRKALEDALELAGRRPARALVGLASLRVFTGNSDGLVDEVHEALRAAEELGDPFTLAQAWNLLGRVQGTLRGTLASAEESWTRGLDYAERGGLQTERAESIGWLMMSANFGPLPVEEGIARCKRFYDEAVDDPFIRANARIEHGALEAMRGDFPVGRRLVAEGRQTLSELGFTLLVATSAQEAFYVEMLAGDTTEALRLGRESYAVLQEMGERSYLSTAAALLAHALCIQGELDEGEEYSRVSEGAAAREDAFSQVLWRAARGKIRARRGQAAEAEALGREAVARVEQTDLLNTQGDTLADLAEVLVLGGRPREAVEVLEQAAAVFERKGNLASLERVRRTARELAE